MVILTKIIIIAISVILPGTLCLIFINRSLVNQIRRTPIYLIKELPSQGKVAFIGKAETNTQKSPILKKECVYFNCYVQELKNVGDDHDPARITLYKHSSVEPLLIGDETGSIQVDLNRAKIILGSDFEEIVTADTHLGIRNNLSELGININSDQGITKSYLVHEESISAGEPIYILGHVHQNKGDRIITYKWNHQGIISDSSQENLLLMYKDQLNLIKKYTPIILITIILILLTNVFVCKWSLP